MTQNERRILTLCGIGHFFAHFYMLMFPSLALWAHKDFQLTLPETLNLGFTMYLLFGLVSLPMGCWLIDMVTSNFSWRCF